MLGIFLLSNPYPFAIFGSTVFTDPNDTLFSRNTTAGRDPDYVEDTPDTNDIKQRCILFLEDGARPGFLFGNSSFGEWRPVFSDLLSRKDNHTVCTEMRVDPPTSTTQGIKTLLSGSYPGFIELGQTFSSSSLTSDHLLKQLHRKGLVLVDHH